MIRTLRVFFLRRLFREKLLILLLLLAAVVVWFSSLSGRAGAFFAEQSRTTTQLRNQKLWLSRGDAIRKRAQAEAAQLDQTKTLSQADLVTLVTQIAQSAGLTNNSTSPLPATNNGQFAVNSITFSVNRATWGAIEKFYAELEKHVPYVSLDKISLAADPSNGALLTSYMQISSVEIVHGS
jgi:Tfp pilus assembly protein PilO